MRTIVRSLYHALRGIQPSPDKPNPIPAATPPPADPPKREVLVSLDDVLTDALTGWAVGRGWVHEFWLALHAVKPDLDWMEQSSIVQQVRRDLRRAEQAAKAIGLSLQEVKPFGGWYDPSKRLREQVCVWLVCDGQEVKLSVYYGFPLAPTPPGQVLIGIPSDRS